MRVCQTMRAQELRARRERDCKWQKRKHAEFKETLWHLVASSRRGRTLENIAIQLLWQPAKQVSKCWLANYPEVQCVSFLSAGTLNETLPRLSSWCSNWCTL